MQSILSRANRDLVRRFAHSNVLLAFDYDGTLAPIVSDPRAAFMRPTTRTLLRRLTFLYPCVVISGRSRADVAALLRGVEVAAIFGNHGIEPWVGARRFVRDVHRWRSVLEKRLAPFRGVRIEDKTYSLAIHYRQCRERQTARDAIFEAASDLGAGRVFGGKLVVNVLPRGAPHKGVALETARMRLGCDTALYVGDDDTDEDVFALEKPDRLLAVRVGTGSPTAAGYFVRRQSAIDRLLQLLVDARARATARARAPARPAATRR